MRRHLCSNRLNVESDLDRIHVASKRRAKVKAKVTATHGSGRDEMEVALIHVLLRIGAQLQHHLAADSLDGQRTDHPVTPGRGVDWLDGATLKADLGIPFHVKEIRRAQVAI